MFAENKQVSASQYCQTSEATSNPPLFLAPHEPSRVADRHFLAQYLNNEACNLIEEKKNYAQAILIFLEALELSNWNLSGEERIIEIQPGPFEHCSLDANLYANIDKEHQSPTAQLGRKQNTNPQTPALDDHVSERFLYRRPLRVNRTCIQEKYYMGIDLTVMILFNLAITNQLLAMSTPTISRDAKIEHFNKALKIYELCIQSHNICGCSEGAGLRLKMMVTNNLSEIHRMFSSRKKYQMCLEYIMQGIMFILHGHDEALNNFSDQHVFYPNEIDGIYKNIQADSSRGLNDVFGGHIHAGQA